MGTIQLWQFVEMYAPGFAVLPVGYKASRECMAEPLFPLPMQPTALPIIGQNTRKQHSAN